MDPQNTNNPDNVSAGNNRQALFTPQPPVAESGAPVSASAQASDGSSTHPYFSSHPTQTFNTDVGDIILNTGSPKPKQNKRPFIIGGIVLVVVVAVCVGILLLVQAVSKPSKADVVKSFNAFKSYIEFGPDHDADDDWYISQLAGDMYDSSDIESATQKIKALYSDFQTKIQESKITINSSLKEAIALETALLDYSLAYANLDNLLQPLVEEYLKPGNEADEVALSERILPAQTTGDRYSTLRDVLKNYIITELEMYAIYNENYCLEGIETSSECVALLDDDDNYTHLLARQNFFASALEQDMAKLWSELKTNTVAIQELINE